MSFLTEGITEVVAKVATPEKIKVEWKYLPDWLFDFSRTSRSSSKFVQLTQPKVYVRTRAGILFGYDVAAGKPIPVPRNAFTQGKFQKFLQSKDFKTFLTFSLIGLTLRTFFKK